VGPEDHTLLASLGDDLKYAFIVSAIELKAGDALAVKASAVNAPKCERCWHWREDVNQDAAHPWLCARCVSNLFGAGETRRIA
jgi:isoleucyl-tRNA synthetase